MNRLFFAILLSVVPTLAYGATTYYVAKTGSDSYSCTQARSVSTPRRTINAGLGCLSAGDTLTIKAGTYSEVIGGKAIPSGGGENTRTIIQGAPGETVVINGSTSTDLFSLDSRRYVTIRNLTLDGMNTGILILSIVNDTHHIRIESSVVRNGVSSCISMRGEGFDKSHIDIIGNQIGPCGTTAGQHSIYLRGAADSLWDGNTIFNGTGYCMRTSEQRGGAPNPRADNLVIRNNRCFNHRAGINPGGGTNVRIYNNLIYNNTVPLGTTSAAIWVSNANPLGAKVYNNTIVGNTGKCVWIYEGTGHVVRNNICWQNADNTIGDSIGTNTISHNLFNDPKFVDATRDMRISTTSPAKDAGLTVIEVATDIGGVSRPWGNGTDIGAFEFVGSVLSAPGNLRIVAGTD